MKIKTGKNGFEDSVSSGDSLERGQFDMADVSMGSKPHTPYKFGRQKTQKGTEVSRDKKKVIPARVMSPKATDRFSTNFDQYDDFENFKRLQAEQELEA